MDIELIYAGLDGEKQANLLKAFVIMQQTGLLTVINNTAEKTLADMARASDSASVSSIIPAIEALKMADSFTRGINSIIEKAKG